MARDLCIAVLDHRNDEYLRDLVRSIHRFCPAADLAWYDSGRDASRAAAPCQRLSCSRPLSYAKVTPFFLDIFEWAYEVGYRYVMNAESDLIFVNRGFEGFVEREMSRCDYLAPRFARRTPSNSRWRPYRTLVGELPELLALLGTDYTNEGFSPAQVFSHRYVDALLHSPFYPRLRSFVERNQEQARSLTLQEVLLPTLPDVLKLTAREYPPRLGAYNRYRPYFSAPSVEYATRRGGIYFVHPVRRIPNSPARRYVRERIASPD